MIKYVKKSLNIFFWLLDKISRKKYKKVYLKYLKWLGVKVDEKQWETTWINPNVFLDSSRYDLIEIGPGVTISFGVSILVHDYSIVHAIRAVEDPNIRLKSIIYKGVRIGKNAFIGANSTILPGAIIGDNCVIGGGDCSQRLP